MPNTEFVTEIFAGKRCTFGGLSNLVRLVALCQKEHKQPKDWLGYARWFRYNEQYFDDEELTENWNWKTSDLSERNRQLTCAKLVCETKVVSGTNREINHENINTLLACMLRVMLNVVPTIKLSEPNRQEAV